MIKERPRLHQLKALTTLLRSVGIEASTITLQQEKTSDLVDAESWACMTTIFKKGTPIEVPPKPKFLNNYPEVKCYD